MRKKCCYGQKNFGSICSSLSPSPTHLSHTTNINPFKNKVWEIYFHKEVCSFVHWSSSLSLTMFPHIFVLWLWLWVYNNCYILIMRDEGRATTLLYKNISLFILLEIKADVVWETDRRSETKTDYYIDPLLLLFLTIPWYVIIKTPLSTSASQLGVLNWRLQRVTVLSRVLSMTTSWLWLRHSLTPTDKQASAYIIS